jgi:hypothetical protein
MPRDTRRRLEAEDALVPAVREALATHAPHVLEELRQLPDAAAALAAALDEWATQHHLQAPCLIIAARDLWRDVCRTGPRAGEARWTGVSHQLPQLPTWDQVLEDIARRPPTWGPYVPVKSLATLEEADCHKQNVLQPLEASRLILQAGLPQTADELEGLEHEIARIQRFYDEELPKRRVEEAERARAYALRPPLYDPVRGCRKEADHRRNEHIRVLTEEARRHGLSLPSQNDDLKNAIRRSIAFQLQSREFDEIALDEGKDSNKGYADLIRQSVTRFCKLVDWTRRPARKGRRHAIRPAISRRHASSHS